MAIKRSRFCIDIKQRWVNALAVNPLFAESHTTFSYDADNRRTVVFGSFTSWP